MSESTVLLGLRKWIKVISRSIAVLAGVEVLLVLFIGIISNNLNDEKYGTLYWIILGVLAVIYVLVTIFKIAYSITFPTSIVNELNAHKQVRELNNDLVRTEAINQYVAMAIQDLSKCVTKMPKFKAGDDWLKASDEDFSKNFKAVSATFNNVLNNIFDCTNIRYTTAIYLNNLRAYDDNQAYVSNKGIFIGRDDHNVSNSPNIKNLLEMDNQAGLVLEIQTAIRYSLNNKKFIKKDFDNDRGKKITSICINIEDFLNHGEQIGVLVILTDYIETLPNDVEKILTIFSNIFSHFRDLYEFKVKDQQLELYLAQSRGEINEVENEGEAVQATE